MTKKRSSKKDRSENLVREISFSFPQTQLKVSAHAYIYVVVSSQVNVFVIHWFNNFPPEFQPPTTFYTLDRVPVNSPIGQVYARSRDIYYPTTVNYTIVGGDGMGEHPHTTQHNSVQGNTKATDVCQDV